MSRSPKTKNHSTPRWLTTNLQLSVAFLAGLLAAGITTWLASNLPILQIQGIPYDAAPNDGVLPAVQIMVESALVSMLVMAACVLVLRKLGLWLSTKQAMSVIFSALVFGTVVMAGSMLFSLYLFNDGSFSTSSALLACALVASGAAFAVAWSYGLRSARTAA